MTEGNVTVGHQAGSSFCGSRCLFLGLAAGRDIRDEDELVIIGDEIRSFSPEAYPDAMFSGNVAIGRTLFGEPIDPEGLLRGDPGALARLLRVTVVSTAHLCRVES